MLSINDVVGRFADAVDCSAGETHYECRDCGTTLSEEADACPACDSDDIAVVDLG